jgi:protein gp37
MDVNGRPSGAWLGRLMGETTIQWTATRGPDGTMHPGFTLNPWIGCERVSPECDFCYADRGSRRLAAQHGLKLWDDGSSRYLTKDPMSKALAWNRKAQKLGVRLKVFCASYSDVFEDRPELVEPRAALLQTIEHTPCLDWLLLTKRPENMRRMTFSRWAGVWPGNVWAGVVVWIHVGKTASPASP